MASLGEQTIALLDQWKQQKRWWVSPLLLGSLWVAYAWGFSFLTLTHPDEGYVVQHAREWLSGKALYIDIVPHIPPGSIFIQAAFAKALGEELWVGRVHYIVSYGIILLLTYACLRTWLSSPLAFILVLPMLSVGGALLPPFAWYNFDATIFYLAAAWVHLRHGDDDDGAAPAFLAGILVGVTGIIKPNFGAMAGLAGFFLRVKARRSVIPFVLGAALPVGALVYSLHLSGGLPGFLAMVVKGQASDKGGLGMLFTLVKPFMDPWLLPKSALPVVGIVLVALKAPLWVAGLGLGFAGLGAVNGNFSEATHVLYAGQVLCALLLGLAAFRVRHVESTTKLPPLALALFAFGLFLSDSVSQSMPWIHNACSFLSIPVLLGTAANLARVGAPIRKGAVVLAAASLLVAGVVAREFRTYLDVPLFMQTRAFETPGLKHLYSTDTHGAQVDAILATVAAETSGNPTGGLFVYPEGPAFYTALGKYTPTRLLNLAPTFTEPIVRAFETGDVMRLVEHPPRFVIFVKAPWFNYRPPRYSPELVMGSTRFRAISQWVVDNYRVRKEHSHLVLLERKPGT